MLNTNTLKGKKRSCILLYDLTFYLITSRSVPAEAVEGGGLLQEGAGRLPDFFEAVALALEGGEPCGGILVAEQKQA